MWELPRKTRLCDSNDLKYWQAKFFIGSLPVLQETSMKLVRQWKVFGWLLWTVLVQIQGNEIITTASCSNLRQAYPARLDTVYLYAVEYYGTLDLDGIERAIATSIVSNLGSCDDTGRPRYAVVVSDDTVHESVSNGT